ncbi:ImmA/IrrE family metallo-endopeptidase, partial [bacterium]|nr:ImmA/IrrE family metallo-endopeptidase [bacterium]
MITAVNPAIIQWARERSGLSLDDLAFLMKRDPDELQQWEDGKLAPSYTTLEDLAYRHFKIPLALFFFPVPPDIDDPTGKFRRLPECELERFSPDTIQKIRSAQAYQDSLEELFVESQTERMIHHDINPIEFTLENLAAKVRKYIGITFKQQFNFRSSNQAFKSWRHALEEAGVFTFKDSFKDRFLSGFCLVHEQYPIIMVNNSNSFTRQIFTLLHELGHILYGVNG